MSGTALLLYSSFFLIFELRIALTGINHEMEFVIRSSQYEAPAELLKTIKKPRQALKNSFLGMMKF
jgi:hypothetical protein